MNGHSSRPTEAVSAVHHATRWIGGPLDLGAELAGRAPADSRFEPPHTTTNVGVVGGGLARCTVAADCSFDGGESRRRSASETPSSAFRTSAHRE